MRGLAQVAFGVFVVFVALIFKQPALLLGVYPVAMLCALPVVYYFVFERHREGHSADIAAQLERIADSLSAREPDERREPSRRSVVGSALLR